MAGIYIHIPFCKQACSYCNFHFSTSMAHKSTMIDAICTEIELRKDYLDTTVLTSVYLGGGTPSLLTIGEFNQIIGALQKHYTFSSNIEITLEANPDDLTPQKIIDWSKTMVNRLSIGVQSFHQEDLVYMNRAHNADEAINCLSEVKKHGFEDLSVDLIYGTPSLSNEQFLKNIQILIDLKIPHISAYALTIEKKTLLYHNIKNKLSPQPNDEKTAEQFNLLVKTLKANGYDHYEISNFSLPNRHAVHNSNYWKAINYLGIGPSAHSFNQHSRSWNIPNNAKYIKGVEANKLEIEVENLSIADQYNEYIMTGFRTKWGVDNERLKSFGSKIYQHFIDEIKESENKLYFEVNNATYTLKDEGKFISDRLISNLFYV